jgi:hypothetical protein
LALATMLERRKLYIAYAGCVGVLALHALRPEWEAWRLRAGDYYPRINVSGSTLFVKGVGEVPMLPDLHAKLVIAEVPWNAFALPLYGRKLTNSVITSVAENRIGPHCEALHQFTDGSSDVLVIDDADLTKDCPRACAVDGGWRCAAYRLDRKPSLGTP